MSELRLTPTGHLCWEGPADQTEPAPLSALRRVFSVDWREGLFTLAAEKIGTGDPASWPRQSLTLRYWQGVADRYLTALCHIPGSAETIEVEPPTPAECATLVLTAPPMRGGEYLTAQVLLSVWNALDRWVTEAIASTDGLEAFVQARAPKWHQVGRVCFHLAENKSDQDRPFAFLATYATGFGAGGRLKHLPLGKALEQYAGAKNRSALIRLLAPVQQAAERCAWVMKLVESGEVYQPLAWTAERAYTFLRTVPELEDSGLSVRLPDWWKKRARPQVSVTIGQERQSALGAKAVLDFDMKLALGDETLSPEELAELLAGEGRLVLLKGKWVEVDREKLREALDHWRAVRRRAAHGEISFIEGMRLLAGASADLRHEERTDEERPWVHVSAGEAMQEILAGLREPSQLDAVELAGGLQGTLRPYQRVGLAWLRFLTTLGLGACLADDMGLGKTIQVLALLLCDRDGESTTRRTPSLLVVPASLLSNWRAEARCFAPSLKLTFLHPAEIDRQTLEQIAKSPGRRLREADLAVTTYSMLTRQDWLTGLNWQFVILDEAQAIKNPSTRQSKAAKILGGCGMSMLRCVVLLIRALLSNRAELAAENLALRRQLAALQRRSKRPRLWKRDRVFWALLSRIWQNWHSALLIVQPDTVVRWHQQGFRLYWRWKSRSAKIGRPKIGAEIRRFIRRVSRENPLWGTPRIQWELRLIGYEVSEATVDKYRIRRHRPPSQTWRTFLDNHVRNIVAVEFFTVPTATFRILFCFFILRHDRRRVVHFNATANPEPIFR